MEIGTGRPVTFSVSALCVAWLETRKAEDGHTPVPTLKVQRLGKG